MLVDDPVLRVLLLWTFDPGGLLCSPIAFAHSSILAGSASHIELLPALTTV
jgi:hypothetical protein